MRNGVACTEVVLRVEDWRETVDLIEGFEEREEVEGVKAEGRSLVVDAVVGDCAERREALIAARPFTILVRAGGGWLLLLTGTRE